MALMDPQALRKKLESLGVPEVKRRLEAGAYGSDKVAIVQAWLAEKASAEDGGQAQKPKTRVDYYLDHLKNHSVIALLVVTATVVGGVAQFTDALARLYAHLPGRSQVAVASLAIPGDTGWILLGDLDPDGQRYVRGPFFEIEKSTYPDKSLTPRKGELLRLLAERNVIIAGYKTSGLSQQFKAPWELNVLADEDYTGVKVPKGAILEVRDVSLGSFPSQPVVVWVRVAAPPK